jgi:hypothetical protein
VKVGTPFGEFPFIYKRLERRPDGMAVIGTVAGIESTVVLDRDDAKSAAKALAIPAAVLGLALLARTRR